MSIYLKYCPRCAKANPANATRCKCGYNFETEKTGTQSANVLIQEEELYAEYLKARLAQAEEKLSVARSALAADRHNPRLAAEAVSAEQVASALRAEFAVQNGKLAAVKRLRAEAGGGTKPDEVFRAIQAARAKTALGAGAAHAPDGGPIKSGKTANTKKCPHCTADVAPSLERCRCGYEFAGGGPDLPPLTLGGGERALPHGGRAAKHR